MTRAADPRTFLYQKAATPRMLRPDPPAGRPPSGAGPEHRGETTPPRRDTGDKTTLKRRPTLAVGMPEAVIARPTGFGWSPAAPTEVSSEWA